MSFQLTAARRRLPALWSACAATPRFQLTAARRRLHQLRPANNLTIAVSTHSRSKAAALCGSRYGARPRRFNSQPLEGGCVFRPLADVFNSWFQLTAARRRLRQTASGYRFRKMFQLTAARRRLRADYTQGRHIKYVSTHSRSKAAARRTTSKPWPRWSFNSQPLEGGCRCCIHCTT